MNHRILDKGASEITDFNGSERKSAFGMRGSAVEVVVVGEQETRDVPGRDFKKTRVPQIHWPV